MHAIWSANTNIDCEVMIPMAVTMKISVFWDVAPCSLVDCN